MTNLTAGFNTYVNYPTANLNYIGSSTPAPTALLGGYLADVNFVDSGALTPDYFATTDANGQWVPKAYTGSYGTNGFHLDFSSGALTSGSNVGLGRDSSGNGNYWNTNNMTVAGNQMIDTPTNNFATINPLDNYTWNI